ncbi:MAG TPA: VIT1/CCC1 transporter family protein [Pyrinomonadaceae bacterium]
MVEHGHSPEAIRERLAEGPRHSYLRDWVYGGIDGAVTTFAVVSGVIGAQLPPAVILVVGAANILADGFSMAASNYLGTKTELEEREYLRRVEHRHIEDFPEGEREEVRQIFAQKGFEGEELERVVELITSDHARWVNTMLTEEYGLAPEVRSPVRAAAATFSAFMVCGVAPLLPFVLAAPRAFTLSAVLTGAAFFAVGSAKSFWSPTPWWRSGLTTLLIGAVAACLAYVVGVLTRGLL